MNNNTFVHKYIKRLITKDDIVLDLTAGNGNDTLFLCKLAKRVYAFDIQESAINNSIVKTKDYDNVIYINDNHSNLDKYINENIKLAIFNLGYLPNSKSTIITNKDDTLLAFKKAYSLLVKNGYIVITFYLGHKGGKDEYYFVREYLTNNSIDILYIYKENNSLLEPITYIIKKQ